MDLFSYLMGEKKAGGGGGGTSNYEELSNKPKINDVELTGNKTTSDLGIIIPDISGKQDIMQYSTIPIASSENVDKIVQFIGTTDSTYTNGYFYKCVATTEDNNTTYSWEQENVQPAPTGVEMTSNKVSTITNSSTNTEYAGAKAVWDLVSSAGGGLEFKGTFDDTFILKENDVGIYVPSRGNPGGMLAVRVQRYGGSSLILNLQYAMIIYYNKITDSTPTTGTTKCLAVMGFRTDNNIGALQWVNVALNNNNLTIVDNWQPQGVYGIINKAQTFAGVKTFSSIPEVSSYTAPTTDTQLTAKKYVDDKPTTYSGYDATKTQVLKNINGTLTWVDE